MFRKGDATMTKYVLLTAIGPDRPGLVDEVSQKLTERGLNIESSRMAVLGGEFAIIMLVAGEPAAADRLTADANEICGRTGLQVFLRPTIAPGQRAQASSVPYRLVAAGMDHQGIVHELSQVLHSFKVNIESLETRVEPAPVSGTPIFTMVAQVAVPADIKIRELRAALDERGDAANVDVEFEPGA
jgi:glycine cleavage system transcriptional repressor